MDAGEKSDEDAVYNFDLFTGNLDLSNGAKLSEITEDLPPDLQNLLANVSFGDPQKNDDDYQAFEQEAQKQRFKVVTNEDLDALAEENNAKSTHWQTTWAVKVFRGDYQSFINKF